MAAVTNEGGDVDGVLDKAIVVFGDTNPGRGFRVPAGEELPKKALNGGAVAVSNRFPTNP